MTDTILAALKEAAEYMHHQTRCPQSHSLQKSSVCDCGCREAESAIAAAIATREAEGWQPIETAPKDGSPFLAFDAYGEYQIARMDEGMFRSWETGKRVDLNEWCPLPAPPEGV